jgi:hypothetical protein
MKVEKITFNLKYIFSRQSCSLRDNYEKQGRTRQTIHHGTQAGANETCFLTGN